MFIDWLIYYYIDTTQRDGSFQIIHTDDINDMWAWSTGAMVMEGKTEVLTEERVPVLRAY